MTIYNPEWRSLGNRELNSYALASFLRVGYNHPVMRSDHDEN
jgi:hypothetical protein